MITLSIITPTYNRVAYLQHCFDSLQRQTCFDFEWIIVDDGSSDGTQNVVSAFSTDRFPIITIRKENGGKHTALNAAHPYIHGRYVLILDSDDVIVPTAVQEVIDAWMRYEQDPKVGIVTFLKGTDKEHPVCGVPDYSVPVEIMRYRRIRYTRSDCCEVIRSELFKKYPFPVFEGERFLSECALWDRVSFTHQCVYIDSVIYLCEYLEDGLTRSGRRLRMQNPLGGMFTSNLRMDRKNYFSERIKNGLLYTCYGCVAGKSMGQQLRESRFPILALACYPFGYCLSRAWKKKYAR